MSPSVAAYQHGIFPRSEAVVAATRGLERGRVGREQVAEAYRADRDDFVRAQQEAGLDYFSDGLLRWQDLFRPLVELSGGLDARTLVRWFDNNAFFRAPEITGDLALTGPVPAVLREDAADLPAPRVATLPSPYLFSRATQSEESRGALMMELTREVLRPVAEALPGLGFEVIHLQEPWLGYFGVEPADWDDLEKALSELHEGLAGRATLVFHLYFGDVGPYADHLRRLPVDAVGIDFVETDLDVLGTRWEVGVLAGILDGRRSPIESAAGSAAFAERVADVLQPPVLYLSSNSDLEFLPAPVARNKVLRLGEAAAIVKERVA